jgi:hypothetical protein
MLLYVIVGLLLLTITGNALSPFEKGKSRAHVRVILPVIRPRLSAAFSVRAGFVQLRVRKAKERHGYR